MIRATAMRATSSVALAVWSALWAVGCSTGGTPTAAERSAAPNVLAGPMTDADSAGPTSTTAPNPAATVGDPSSAVGTSGNGAGVDAAPESEEGSISLPTGIEPIRIEIPAIDVDAEIVDLDLAGTQPEVPEEFDHVGWYRQTRRPGEIGPAVLAGHVDSVAGPAVFAQLSDVAVGDTVIVHGSRGESREFEVVGSGQYGKSDLPREVFGFGSARPELRLITCGGSFDRSTGHYGDNVVVYLVTTG